MIVKPNITLTRSAAHILAVLFIMTVASFFILSFTNTALAQGSMEGKWGMIKTVKGEVMSIDHLNNATILTLMPSQMGRFPNNKLYIVLNRDTNVQVCKASQPIKDISVRRNATVIYHELGGIAVAEWISELC